MRFWTPPPRTCRRSWVSATRCPTFRGKVVGLLENRKYHADAFLGELKEVLLNDYGAKKVVYATKFTYSAACAPETLESLAQECDVVIHAIAD